MIAPVLAYHAITTRPSERMERFATTPDMLSRHIAVLRASGYTLVTLSDLAGELRAGLHRPVAAITFDDALVSVYDRALPVLRETGTPATLYVPTAWVGTRAGWMRAPEMLMSWPQLRDLHAEGVELGAHGHSHRQLDVIARPGDDIRTSKRILEDAIQSPVRSFAYPYGAHDPAIRDAVTEAGFENAAAVKQAWSHGASDPFAVARMLVAPQCDVSSLRVALARREPLDPITDRLRTRAFRHWRRLRELVSPAPTGP